MCSKGLRSIQRGWINITKVSTIVLVLAYIFVEADRENMLKLLVEVIS